MANITGIRETEQGVDLVDLVDTMRDLGIAHFVGVVKTISVCYSAVNLGLIEI